MIFKAGIDRYFKRAINKLLVNPEKKKILGQVLIYGYFINLGSVSEFSTFGWLLDM